MTSGRLTTDRRPNETHRPQFILLDRVSSRIWPARAGRVRGGRRRRRKRVSPATTPTKWHRPAAAGRPGGGFMQAHAGASMALAGRGHSPVAAAGLSRDHCPLTQVSRPRSIASLANPGALRHRHGGQGGVHPAAAGRDHLTAGRSKSKATRCHPLTPAPSSGKLGASSTCYAQASFAFDVRPGAQPHDAREKLAAMPARTAAATGTPSPASPISISTALNRTAAKLAVADPQTPARRAIFDAIARLQKALSPPNSPAQAFFVYEPINRDNQQIADRRN